MNNNIQEKKETLLPPPELLERYESISKGLSQSLVELVKKEQEHRHELQDKYLMHFRLGQIFSSFFLIAVIFVIWQLAMKGQEKIAYTLCGIFGVIIVLILIQYRKDKLSAVIRNSKKTSFRRFNPNFRRSSYPTKR